MFLWWPGKNCYRFAGKFWFIHCIHQTLYVQISISFSLYKILLMEKNSIPWKIAKSPAVVFLLKEIKSFREIELWSCLKMAEASRTKTVNIWFSKVLGENEKYIFYFYLKTKGTFCLTQLKIRHKANEKTPKLKHKW